MPRHRHDFAPPANRRTTRRDGDLLFDADLSDLPQAMRWCEWMGRGERRSSPRRPL
ncbi:hypothetical protein [Methylocystis rosea]|uniref:hypothetical protein n=1 Tax=Methylocystis rosea TaxID=173366 RepID=UPI0003717835